MHDTVRTIATALLVATTTFACAGCSALVIDRQPDNHRDMERLIEAQNAVHATDVRVERSVDGLVTSYDVTTRVGLNHSAKIRDETALVQWLWDVSKELNRGDPYSEVIVLEDREIDVERVFRNLHLDFDPLISIDAETGGARFTIWDSERDYDAPELPGDLPKGVLTY